MGKIISLNSPVNWIYDRAQAFEEREQRTALKAFTSPWFREQLWADLKRDDPNMGPFTASPYCKIDGIEVFTDVSLKGRKMRFE